MQDLLRRRYPNNYDPMTAARWVKEHVIPSPLLYLGIRTDDAFLIALVNQMPWVPGENIIEVVSLCADDDPGWPFQTVKLLRASIEWARHRNAKAWRICSETHYDLEPLARRVGAHAVSPRYILELRG